ncbi:SRPBCC family protein [Streptomyces sp. NPDC051597]|uniref:SRPBCC family protein n=1 Tax=Streptomyces sp. NPDC051597 TaxID=3155049 RepID=UPI00343E2C31
MSENGKKEGTGLIDSAVTDRLKSELQSLALAQVERALVGIGRKLGESTVKLNDIAEGRSPGFAELALKGGRKLTEGKGPMRAALELGADHLKENVTDAFKNLGGKRGKSGGGRKPTVIMESVDVGVPVRDAYDQWTQYQEFSHFAKGVRSAESADDTTSDWKLKVFWSTRSWKAHTTEQIPDARIAWTSEGAKGTTKGVVTFHPLGASLTRVLLVIEYYPKGLFEKTGNIWRAQGRRARLDLKNFARHIALRGEAPEGWRGEIRDGEVVLSHEDALEREEKTREASHEGDAHEEDADGGGKASQDTYEEAYDDEEPLEGEYDEEVEEGEEGEEPEEIEEPEEDEDVPEDAHDEAPEDDSVEYAGEWEEDEAEEPEPEPEPEESGRRPAKSGSRRR